MPTEYILDQQTAEQIARMEAVQSILVPIAAIILGIAAVVFLILNHLRETDTRDQTIKDLQTKIERLTEERDSYWLKLVDAAYERNDLVADCNWKIADAEQKAKERIAAAEQKQQEAEGRKRQAESRADQIAEAKEMRRKVAVA